MNVDQLAVNEWFAEWEQLQQTIHTLHQERDANVVVHMTKAIALFENFVTDENLMPTNGQERLTFVKSRPAQYACYRQLDELFKETKKRAARLRIQQKK